MTIPAHLSYTTDHEWLALDGDTCTVGVTEYAATALGDVVFVEAPEVGQAVTAAEACGEIESTKAVSDLIAPVSGEVVEVNPTLRDKPGLINSDPYQEGWIFRVRVTRTPADLLDANAYAAHIGEA
ncbi:glycine cleavage system H protein [Parafrankia irregularis]|uniref:Glycine cleavage system H protein n=1 Tax=Parafrankia irregularis TaxID=795642 RepID=A0A0S4QHD0_9ACTN|nr:MULTISPECIES: glycine cleavage system protein GcvH [Parafrankia]MBE3204191.1 glycine cleavage system protein GcvH [Parafrankia sp. CH37]CUU54929.1 glycine cleavage system H protein [Parafrankia irregularis]